MSKSNPRRANGNLRTKLRNRMASRGLPCALCGESIDYSLPAGHPMSYELDEILPVSRWEEGGYISAEQCALDPDNHQPAHRICNQRKGNGLRRIIDAVPEIVTSRDWVEFAKRKGGVSPHPDAAATPGA